VTERTLSTEIINRRVDVFGFASSLLFDC